jgi:rhamnose transport system substrate-binding protein
MWAYAAQCYPELEWLETVETQDDAVLAYNQAAVLLGEYSSDVSGFISVTTTATPNAAQAISQGGMCGNKVVVGLATPNDMKPAINSGCVQSAVLWNPADLGYAAVYVMRAAADGVLQPGATEVDAGQLGTMPVMNGSEIVLGPPLIINARNINDLNF